MKILFILCLSLGSVAAAQPFEINDGDRIVFVGDTLIEREQTHGHVETRLHVRFPDRKFIVRNLAWSADTPAGISRAGFDFQQPEKGFERLREQLVAMRPTVAFIGYGMANSFAGPAGIPAFKGEMGRLMDEIQKIGSNQVRFVLLSPIRHERLPGLPVDPTQHNEQLSLYSQAIKELADARGALFVHLFETLDSGKETLNLPYTDNGIHLTEYGYSRLADAIEIGLGWTPNWWRFGVMNDGKLRPGTIGITVENVERGEDFVRAIARPERLGNPNVWKGEWRQPSGTPENRLQIFGLSPGHYTLKLNGQPVAKGTEKDWADSLAVYRGPSFDQAEELRQAVVRKNELFFHRWRPENETYLFGFRKHEQGKNAREIPMFDPLIVAEEQRISTLRQPGSLRVELIKGSETIPAPKRLDKKTDAPGGAEASRNLPHFDVAEGFEVTLFAENPHLAKPIQMNFDPEGRLWIASSSVYPQIEPGKAADDKILVVEDTDGDGKADRSKVFAGGLLIPTGVEPGDGGVYVGQSTELLHLKDTDGDGQADQRRVVLSGFGTEDTHHILHTLRWGHDGQLYFNQSIYIHSHIETPHGVVRLNSGGIFNFRPDTSKLEVFLKGFCNPWGHHFDEFGQSFVTDGAGFQGITYGVRGATYFTYADMRREMKSVSPGNYPKFCGLELVQTPQFPDDWQGNLVTCDFRAHRIVRFGVTEQGAGFVTRELPDLLRTTNVTFRPIDVKFGPDGALYIADWSNPIIQHGEVDFRDPRRDHERGRIWRVAAKGRVLAKRVGLRDTPTPNLLNSLTSVNGFERQQGRRVLFERDRTETAPVILKWTREQTSETAKLEGLWALQGTAAVEADVLKGLLKAKDGRVRAAAVRVLSFWLDQIPNATDLLAEAIKDEHPRVRLEAVRALARIPNARSAEIVLSVLDRPMDYFIEYAAWLSINDLAQPWVDAVRAGEWKAKGKEAQLEFALKSIEPAMASQLLAQLLTENPLPKDGSGPWIQLIGQTGSATDLRKLVDQIVIGAKDNGFQSAAVQKALDALSESARLRKVKPGGDLSAISRLVKGGDENVRIAAIRLAGSWGLKSAIPDLLDEAAKGSSPASQAAAFESLRQVGGPEVVAGLKKLVSGGNEAVRQGAAIGLAHLDLEASAKDIAAVVASTAREEEALALWRSILGVKGAGARLAPHWPRTDNAATARAGLRIAREGNRKEPELIAVLDRASNVSEAGGPSDADLQQLAKDAAGKGDPVKGELIYRRPELACITCHAIGGAGGKVGPDMTSIGASAPVDYLVESLFYPNRKIKEGYHSVILQMKDEQELSGLVLRENAEEILLRDSSNREVSIAKANVVGRTTGASLMPSGLLDSVTPSDRLDLIRFLSELGKPGAFDASKGGVARVWKLRPGTHTVEQFGEQEYVSGKVTANQWMTVYSTVNGALPRDSMKEALNFENVNRYTGVVAIFAATAFQATRNGRVTLEVEVSTGADTWIDGKHTGQISREGTVTTELSPGRHTLVMKLDPRALPENLRVRSGDVSFISE